MDVDLDLYKIFYTVAKYKHMTKASEELFISQPAISQSIKKLEEQLGGILFVRSNKGMELTSEGKMLFEHIKGALEIINNAENEFSSFKSLDKGEIKIGCSTTLTKLVLLESVKEYHKEYPGIKVTIVNDLTSNLINSLKLGKLDIVIFNEGNIKENNLSLVKIKELKQGFVYNSDYFSDKIVDLSQLNDYPLILQKEESNSRKFLDHFVMTKGVKLIPGMEVVSQDLVIEFTNIGLGIGFSIIDLAKSNIPKITNKIGTTIWIAKII